MGLPEFSYENNRKSGKAAGQEPVDAPLIEDMRPRIDNNIDPDKTHQDQNDFQPSQRLPEKQKGEEGCKKRESVEEHQGRAERNKRDRFDEKEKTEGSRNSPHD